MLYTCWLRGMTSTPDLSVPLSTNVHTIFVLLHHLLSACPVQFSSVHAVLRTSPTPTCVEEPMLGDVLECGLVPIRALGALTQHQALPIRTTAQVPTLLVRGRALTHLRGSTQPRESWAVHLSGRCSFLTDHKGYHLGSTQLCLRFPGQRTCMATVGWSV